MARRTNVQWVKHAMEYSKFGALSQAFIMEAIGRYANQIAELDPARLDSALISGEAWVGVAKEIKASLDAHYKG